MLKLIAAALALTTIALPAAAQTKPTAADYAKNMQGAVGQVFEGGIKISSLTAEGNTVVFVVDGPKGWRANLAPDVISSALVGGFCQTAPDFFSSGVTMRVDSTDDGKRINGPLANACPPAPAK